MQYIVHYIVEYSVQCSEQYIIKEAKRVVFLKELANHFNVCVYYYLKYCVQYSVECKMYRSAKYGLQYSVQ